MKQVISILLVLTLLLTALFSTTAYADGDGNIDNGGGGLGSGTSENFWNTGDEGVRVTVVKASDGSPVTTPIDFTNKKPASTILIKSVRYNMPVVLVYRPL